jgi:hypothetical protein
MQAPVSDWHAGATTLGTYIGPSLNLPRSPFLDQCRLIYLASMFDEGPKAAIMLKSLLKKAGFWL